MIWDIFYSYKDVQDCYIYRNKCDLLRDRSSWCDLTYPYTLPLHLSPLQHSQKFQCLGVMHKNVASGNYKTPSNNAFIAVQ